MRPITLGTSVSIDTNECQHRNFQPTFFRKAERATDVEAPPSQYGTGRSTPNPMPPPEWELPTSANVC